MDEVVAACGDGLGDILFDSGVFVYVCPRDYRADVGLGKADSEFGLQSATGSQIKIDWCRTVWHPVVDGRGMAANLCVTYVVCDARRPIVAFAALVDRGCRVELGEMS